MPGRRRSGTIHPDTGGTDGGPTGSVDAQMPAAESTPAGWGAAHQEEIARWLSAEVARRGSLDATPERQLNWVARCARSGPVNQHTVCHTVRRLFVARRLMADRGSFQEACREDLLGLLEMQLNVLMLLFGGTAGFFAMLPPSTTIGALSRTRGCQSPGTLSTSMCRDT